MKGLRMHPLQCRFESIVRAGNVSPDSLWGQRVDAVNVQIPFGVSDALLDIRRSVSAAAEDCLLEIPAASLHISVLWIVAARVDYGAERLAIWNEIAEPAIKAFTAVIEATEPFEVRFEDLVATDTTVMLIGQDKGELAALRSELKKRLPLPPLTNNRQEIIHCTLFRYKSELRDQDRFWRVVRVQEPNIAITAHRIEIRHEIIYPSLESELIAGRNFGSGLAIASNRGPDTGLYQC